MTNNETEDPERRIRRLRGIIGVDTITKKTVNQKETKKLNRIL